MRTLLFTLEFPPFKGGVANYYGHLAQDWPINESLTILDNNQAEIINQEWPGSLAWLAAIFTLKRKIKQGKIDYVLVGQILPLGTVAWLLSFFRSLPYAVFLHGMDLAYALRTPRKRWLAARILKKADKIIAANSYVAQKASEFQPDLADKISIVNPGIESSAPLADETLINNLKEQYGLKDKIVLFTLGRLVRRKGVDKVIEALELIPEPLIHNLSYFIAGTGPEKDYLQSLVPVKFFKKIIFLDEIKEEEKWAWLRLSDIFIMPSRDIAGDFEGFGIVYLEANLCGRPVIAGRAGGIQDAVVDGYNGLLVNPESAEEIKAAIITLANDPARRDQLGRQGEDRARQDFNWEKQTAGIANLIKGGAPSR